MRSTSIVPALAVAAVAACLADVAVAAPFSPNDVPPALRPWTAWVLHENEDSFCPTLVAREDASECAWPARLGLVLDERAGRFTQEWQTFKETWVPLPGGAEHWPLDVRDGAATAIVVEKDGVPGVVLAAGRHTLTGTFAWDGLPEALPVPAETGLLTLSVRGARIPFPERGPDGAVFLERTVTAGEEETLDLTVHRKVTDEIPVLLTTRLQLSVSGKSREVLLGKCLPDGFVPVSIEAPLPARLESDGHLRVQVRPGSWTVTLVARHEGPVSAIARPDAQGLWKEGDEVWVYEARPSLRAAAVTAVPAIDPQQTTLPDEWKPLPAYAVAPGATVRFEESRRGDAEPAPDRLALMRQLWLDFDGGGYTVSDTITGSMHRGWRVEMDAPGELGRVAIGGRDQLITRVSGSARAGVEIRQGKVALVADSRITGPSRRIPAVGWDQDFERVSATLALPPGWRLFHAFGADAVSPTWVKSWTLYDLFLLVLIALAAAKLFGLPVGVLCFFALALTFPEAGAPKNAWLAILAGEALLLVWRQPGKLRSLLRLYFAGAWLVFAILVLPFVVQQIRQGLHPAHEQTWSGMSYESSLANLETQSARGGLYGVKGPSSWERDELALEAPPPPPSEPTLAQEVVKAAPVAATPKPSRPVKGQRIRGQALDELLGSAAPLSGPQVQAPTQQLRTSKLNVQDYDPNAMVQTGPGLPAWTWRTVNLSWNGPVQRNEQLRLVLLGPRTNLVLMLLRVGLLVLTVVLFMRPRQRGGAGWWRKGASALALLAVLAPGAARAAELPTPELLEDLRAKLTERPDCEPNCATLSRLALDVSPRRLQARIEATAASLTAVPLPGGKAQWSPEQVSVDGRPASALVRTGDGVLFVELAPGGHVIVVEGALPSRETVQLSLPGNPRHVTVKAVGWMVAGVHEDGIADADLQLTRIASSAVAAGAPLRGSALPPFARVERTLVLGLRWEVDTTVVRASPTGTPVVLEVPLLPGESVTTPGIRVAKGKVLVNLGAQESALTWHATLVEQPVLELRAPEGVPWVEVWRLDASPVWHTTTSGIPPIHVATETDVRLPEWRPWPGEKLRMEASRPAAVPGQTLTIQGSRLLLTPGLRASDAVLSMQLRSSRGEQHTVVLPEGAVLSSVTINGVAQPVRQAGRDVTLPIAPGQQRVEIGWREARGIRGLLHTPPVDLRAPSVNSEVRIQMSRDRWILFLGGPTMGPSVLWWSLVLALIVAAIPLGRTGLTPLAIRHWALLGLGLSQVSVVAAAVVALWLLAFGWRRKHGAGQSAWVFNGIQIALVGLSVAALVILFHAVETGLLRQPDMGISGNQSHAGMLSWFQDRSSPVLVQPWVLSVPLLVYRLAMLAWAIWLATSLLRWGRWLWASFGEGGFWQRLRKPVVQPPSAKS